jgi:hypothetical protein
MAPALSFEIGLKAQVLQGVEIEIAHQGHRTTMSAVTTGWPSPGDKFFPPKGHTAITTIATAYPDDSFIDENHGIKEVLKREEIPIRPKDRMEIATYSAGKMCTNLPRRPRS